MLSRFFFISRRNKFAIQIHLDTRALSEYLSSCVYLITLPHF
jgi:hypothetical protein